MGKFNRRQRLISVAVLVLILFVGIILIWQNFSQRGLKEKLKAVEEKIAKALGVSIEELIK